MSARKERYLRYREKTATPAVAKKGSKQHRLTDDERESIQFVALFSDLLNISQLARAMKCSRATVRYWQAETRDKKGERQFVRPKGMFADGR